MGIEIRLISKTNKDYIYFERSWHSAMAFFVSNHQLRFGTIDAYFSPLIGLISQLYFQ
jgi:hypothetical protein